MHKNLRNLSYGRIRLDYHNETEVKIILKYTFLYEYILAETLVFFNYLRFGCSCIPSLNNKQEAHVL